VRSVQFWIYAPVFHELYFLLFCSQLHWAEKCFSQQSLPKSGPSPTPTAVFICICCIAGGAGVDVDAAGPLQLCE
jgi:hypothetical protein